jgi:hypothetical protein
VSRKGIETDRFQAGADDGSVETVIEYTSTPSFKADGRAKTIKGSKEFSLLNGHSVNQIGSETFQVVETDKIIRKVL